MNHSYKHLVNKKEIAHLAKTSSNHTTDIASSSEEQLAIMQQVTSSAATLANMAEGLQSLVNRFPSKSKSIHHI